MIKLQMGEYVSLGKVESELKTCPLIENICIYGDASRDYIVALVMPNHHHLEELASTHKITFSSFEDLCNNSTIEKLVLNQLVVHSKKCKYFLLKYSNNYKLKLKNNKLFLFFIGNLQKFEIPVAVKLVTDTWSPDTGLVTAAFKIKRKVIEEYYKDEISRMYAS